MIRISTISVLSYGKTDIRHVFSRCNLKQGRPSSLRSSHIVLVYEEGIKYYRLQLNKVMIQLVSKVSLSNKDAVPPLPLVTLEDHFLAPSFEDNPEIARLYNFFPSRTKDSLRDLSDARLANMDEGGVAVQVVSHGPGAGNADQCRAANDHLAAAIAKHPERLRGFATLSMGDADAAAKEFARCVRELGFVGALIENNTGGRHYDHEQFWPVFAMAQELDVPIYIHPAFPEGDFAEHLKGEYADVI